MDWELRANDSVFFRSGTIRSNRIAAFDFVNTLVWSAIGLHYLSNKNDVVHTGDVETQNKIFKELVDDNWTIVLFVNADLLPTYFLIDIINRFFDGITSTTVNPSIYISMKYDKYHIPGIGMWNIFLEDFKLQPSPASFYCGGNVGPQSPNPLYRIDSSDSEFAKKCGLSLYTPDDIVGVFTQNRNFSQTQILIVLAAHKSQYQDFLDDFLKHNPHKQVNWSNALLSLKHEPDTPLVVVDESLALVLTKDFTRTRYLNDIPEEYHQNTKIIAFTRPIKPFTGEMEYNTIKQKLRIWDINLLNQDEIIAELTGGLVDIIRIN